MSTRSTERIGVFIAANGFLGAVLLVWAQLWTHSSIVLPLGRHAIRGATKSILLPSAEFGLAWTYSAVVLTLLATGTTVVSHLLPRREMAQPADDSSNPPQIGTIAMGLFLTALEMGVLNVAQSAVSAVVRLVQYSDQPQRVMDTARMFAASPESALPERFLLASLILVLLLVALCSLGVRDLKATEGLSRLRFWALNAAAVTAFYEFFALPLREEALGDLYEVLQWLPALMILLVPKALPYNSRTDAESWLRGRVDVARLLLRPRRTAKSQVSIPRVIWNDMVNEVKKRRTTQPTDKPIVFALYTREDDHLEVIERREMQVKVSGNYASGDFTYKHPGAKRDGFYPPSGTGRWFSGTWVFGDGLELDDDDRRWMIRDQMAFRVKVALDSRGEMQSKAHVLSFVESSIKLTD